MLEKKDFQYTKICGEIKQEFICFRMSAFGKILRWGANLPGFKNLAGLLGNSSKIMLKHKLIDSAIFQANTMKFHKFMPASKPIKNRITL